MFLMRFFTISIMWVFWTTGSLGQSFERSENEFMFGSALGLRNYLDVTTGCKNPKIIMRAMYDLPETSMLYKFLWVVPIRNACGYGYSDTARFSVEYYVIGKLVAKFALEDGRDSKNNLVFKVSNLERIAQPNDTVEAFEFWRSGDFTKVLPRTVPTGLTGDAALDYQFSLAADRELNWEPFRWDVANGYFPAIPGGLEVKDEKLMAKVIESGHPNAVAYDTRSFYRQRSELGSLNEKDRREFFSKLIRMYSAGLFDGYLWRKHYEKEGYDVVALSSGGTPKKVTDSAPTDSSAHSALRRRMKESNCSDLSWFYAKGELDAVRSSFVSSSVMTYHEHPPKCIIASPGIKMETWLESVSVSDCVGVNYSYVCSVQPNVSCYMDSSLFTGGQRALLKGYCQVFVVMANRAVSSWTFQRDANSGNWESKPAQ